MIPTALSSCHYHFKGGATHGVIYSKKAMENYVNEYEKLTIASDIYWNKYNDVYCYYKPFCFQLLPETENSKGWSNWIDINLILRCCFKADKTHEYLFPFVYNASKFGYIIGIAYILNKFKK